MRIDFKLEGKCGNGNVKDAIDILTRAGIMFDVQEMKSDEVCVRSKHGSIFDSVFYFRIFSRVTEVDAIRELVKYLGGEII